MTRKFMRLSLAAGIITALASIFSMSASAQQPYASFTENQIPSLTLGALKYNDSGGPDFTFMPEGVFTDGVRLFVADTRNNRVLIWNTLPTRNGQPADLVLGQENFYTSLPGTSPSEMNNPMDVHFDGQKLFVADFNNDRILIWNSLPTRNGQPADVVLSGGLRSPYDVFSDGVRLYVTDTGNNRVLIWNTIPTGDAPASVVVGQSDFGGTSSGLSQTRMNSPRSVCAAGGKLFVADSFNHRVLIYNTIPTTHGAAADVVVGQSDFNSNADLISQSGLSKPYSVWSDGTRLCVANGNRVLIWNSIPTTNGAPADVVLGQPDFTSNNHGTSAKDFWGPRGTAVGSGRLLIADIYNSRVLIYSSIPSSNYLPADIVIGQQSFDTSPLKTPWGFMATGVAVDRSNDWLYIGESGGMGRILRYDSIPTHNQQATDRQWSFGGVFDLSAANGYLAIADRGRNQVILQKISPVGEIQSSVSLSGLQTPYGVFTDGIRLIASDTGNNRVLIWNSLPTQNDESPDVVVGQPDFTSTSPATTRSSLNGPKGVLYVGGKLFVADTNNNRVLIWNSLPTTNGAPADLVLGQADFNTSNAGPEVPEANRLACPTSLASDGTMLFVSSPGDGRLLVYPSIPTVNAAAPDVTLRPPGGPGDLDFDGTCLWVSDGWYYRVWRYGGEVPSEPEENVVWPGENKAVKLNEPTNTTTNSTSLSWSQFTGENFLKYEVHTSTTSGFTPSSATLLAAITDRATTSYTADNLSPGTTYYFKILTYTLDGMYAESNQESATTLEAGEGPPGVNWLLVGGSMGAVLLFIVVVVFALRRK
jgi:hypothetical protein